MITKQILLLNISIFLTTFICNADLHNPLVKQMQEEQRHKTSPIKK